MPGTPPAGYSAIAEGRGPGPALAKARLLAAPERRPGPAVSHQAGAYRQISHEATAMSTTRETMASRVIPTRAAVIRTPVRSSPATRAGSPPSRSGVRALAASPNALTTTPWRSGRRFPAPA